jgi:hypothetical protein
LGRRHARHEEEPRRRRKRAGFAVARLGGPWALFIDAASFLLMGLLVLTLPTISREPRVAQHAAANRWLGFIDRRPRS